jgi:hypothetical protein
MPIVSYRFNDTCRKKCPENYPCTLSKHHKHELCICDEERCKCHSEGRYLEAKKAREND